jgi:hypothetical protein
MTGTLDMNNNQITFLPNPAGSQQPVPLGYADARYVALAGSASTGPMTGDLSLGRLDQSTGHGATVRTDGLMATSITGTGGGVTSTPNIQFGRGGAPANSSGVFCSFRANSSSSGAPHANYLGGIVITTVNANIAYNTSSDKRLKRLTRVVDGDEALDKVATLEPVGYTWIVAPEAVTPGTGEPGDDDFIPWSVDLSKLVPTLVAAVQALTRRVQLLEEAATA